MPSWLRLAVVNGMMPPGPGSGSGSGSGSVPGSGSGPVPGSGSGSVPGSCSVPSPGAYSSAPGYLSMSPHPAIARAQSMAMNIFFMICSLFSANKNNKKSRKSVLGFRDASMHPDVFTGCQESYIRQRMTGTLSDRCSSLRSISRRFPALRTRRSCRQLPIVCHPLP